MNSVRRYIIFQLCIGFVHSALYGQSHPNGGSAANAVPELARLQQYDAPSDDATITTYIGRADESKSLSDQSSITQEKAEAKRIEALNLIYAAYLGEVNTTDRKDKAVRQVRSDKSLTESARLKVAAYNDNMEARLSAKYTFQERMDKYENTCRNLIAEFPGASENYESFVRLADDAVEPQAQKIATDLLSMSAADNVKQDAGTIIARYALVGESLDPLLNATRQNLTLKKSQIAILYTWSVASEGVYLAKDISRLAPSGANIAGICVDTDLAGAKKAAQTLPGSQLYSLDGVDPKLAKHLRPLGHDLVIIADRTGKIISVSGRIDMQEKINAAANK